MSKVSAKFYRFLQLKGEDNITDQERIDSLRAEIENARRDAEQKQKELEAILNKPHTWGYVRVSSYKQGVAGNSVEDQKEELLRAGVESDCLVCEVYTGTTMERPKFDELLTKLKSGDTLKVVKLDRLARTASAGYDTIKSLLDRGINIHVLNMGLVDNSPMGRLILQVLLAFSEFEHDMILERTASGRRVARMKEGYKEGRPKKFSQKKLDSALELLETHSTREVVELTEISRSTLLREKAKRKAAKALVPEV